jgi:hypothetical protein
MNIVFKAFIFLKYTQSQRILSFENSAKFKNLKPGGDSNPGSAVLEADALTTLPRRQGT